MEPSETYYARNRERLLQRQIEYNKRPEYRQYQKDYYQRARIKKQVEDLKKLTETLKNEPTVNLTNMTVAERPDQRGKHSHKRGGRKGARPPKPYYETSKIDEPEAMKLTDYAKKKLEITCPLGYYQRPETDNPFRLTFD